MIGLVIVSHSKALAKSLAELVKQIITSARDVPLAYCGGAGENHDEFGTDAIEIMEAVQSLSELEGILILVDLGSAVLSAEMALDLLPEEISKKVKICPAPLVEGAITVGVQASLGSDLKTAFYEAQQSLSPKLEHLGYPSNESHPVVEPLVTNQEAREVVLDIHNTHGLHARPAVLFIQKAAQFDAQIQVVNLTNNRGPISAKSMNAIIGLGAVQGHKIQISASGVEADKAIQALKRLVESNFGESVSQPPKVKIAQEKEGWLKASLTESAAQTALSISDGYVLGELYHYQPPTPTVPTNFIVDAQKSWQELLNAIDVTKRAIHERRQQTKQRIGEEQAAIFDAHILILEDPEILEKVKATIFEKHTNPALAWQQNIHRVAESYTSLEDSYLQQRAADVIDVGNQVLFALLGESAQVHVHLPKPVILVAEELTPTQTSQLDLDQVLGIVTMSGGATSHSAIIARSLGIPAISGVSDAIKAVSAGTLIGLDGFHGLYWLSPDESIQAELKQKRTRWLSEKAAYLTASREQAVTLDGKRIEVVANVGNLKDAQLSVVNGAEGVGLLRTEFLFLTRQDPPSEEEQYQALRDIGKTVNPYAVIVRTLDVGGDKELPYIQLAPEANPFLGVRALRLSLQRKDLFHTQLRAIMRAAAETNLRVMFPMVADIKELRQAKKALEEVHLALQKEGVHHKYPLETGIMVEIPSSALLASLFAKEVDFFSIGTNDLTQYTLAAERGNPSLSYLSDALHPAVLQLINHVAQAAHQEGKWVGVCGELAADVAATPILIGLGVDELSLSAVGIPRVKAVVRKIKYSDAKTLAINVLQFSTAEEVRTASAQYLKIYE